MGINIKSLYLCVKNMERAIKFYEELFEQKVTEKDDTNITFDANHEMASKELNFRIELVEVL